MSQSSLVITRECGPSAELGAELAELDRVIWHSDPLDVMPSWRFLIAPRLGGELIVARRGERAIGFALCTPCIDERDDAASHGLYLELLGVHPDFQHARLGERLMRELFTVAAARNIPRVAWTFDPLEGPNANLYLAKLGARGVRFLPNFYGNRARDGSEGERTDRLWAEVDLAARAARPTTPALRPEHVFDVEAELLTSLPTRLGLAVPADFAVLRAGSPERARSVRARSGELLTELFARRFTVVGFERGGESNVLVLERH